MSSPVLITDFAMAEYNKKLTPNKIAEIMATLATVKFFSIVVNERYLVMIKSTPYKKKKLNGADYGNDYPYEEIYKNAYLVTKHIDTDMDDDVCCVVCDEVVCNYAKEPLHKDERDEAVCDDCWVHYKYTTGYDKIDCDTWGEGTPKGEERDLCGCKDCKVFEELEDSCDDDGGCDNELCENCR